MQRDFQNKTVVITGACRGIGAGIAERFARDGANLVMVSNAERVHETAETLRQRYQADILSLRVDVTDEAQVQSLYEQAAARFGTIDVSIQNAGVITIDYYDRMPKADFEKVLAVNTTGVWLRCREAAKYMVKQNHGSLINTSFRPGATGFYLHAALRRQQNGRDRHYPKPGARAGTVEHHRQRLLPRHH